MKTINGYKTCATPNPKSMPVHVQLISGFAGGLLISAPFFAYFMGWI